MKCEGVGTVRPGRRPLVLARDDRDGAKAGSMKMSRDIRSKRKKQGIHKATNELSQMQLPWIRGRQLGNRNGVFPYISFF